MIFIMKHAMVFSKSLDKAITWCIFKNLNANATNTLRAGYDVSELREFFYCFIRAIRQFAVFALKVLDFEKATLLGV